MILVLGKNGQLARGLAEYSECVFLDRSTCDLAKPEEIVSALLRAHDQYPDMTAIINAAAYTDVNRAETEESLCMKINAESPAVMADFCKKQTLPFLHVSSDYVYGDHGHSEILESQPHHPEGAYARSKARGDEAVQQVGGGARIVRTSWVYDATGVNFFTKIKKQIKSGSAELKIVGDQWGAPTYAPDLAEWCMKILKQGIRGTSVVHATNAGCVSWFQFAQMIAARLDYRGMIKEVKSSDFPSPVLRPTNSRLSLVRLNTEFNIYPRSIEAALDHCVNHSKFGTP